MTGTLNGRHFYYMKPFLVTRKMHQASRGIIAAPFALLYMYLRVEVVSLQIIVRLSLLFTADHQKQLVGAQAQAANASCLSANIESPASRSNGEDADNGGQPVYAVMMLFY